MSREKKSLHPASTGSRHAIPTSCYHMITSATRQQLIPSAMSIISSCREKFTASTLFSQFISVLYFFNLICILSPFSPSPFLSFLCLRAPLHVVVMFRFMSFDINQPSLPTPFYSVLVFISVYLALSTVFHSIISPNNSPLSHSVLPVLFLLYWSFQLHYLVMKVSLCPDIVLCG